MKRIAAAGAAMVAATVGFGALATPAFAVSSTGAVTITDPSTNTPLTTAQVSTKKFGVTVPQGAVCPGNTATGGYRIYSFMIQGHDADPSALDFSSGTPSDGLGYYVDPSGAYYGPINTGSNGEVPTAPFMSWSSAGLGQLDVIPTGTSAVWNSGIACADSTGHLVKFWNQNITFNSSGASDFTWTPEAASTNTPEVPNGLIFPVAGAGIAAGGYLLMRRRRKTAGSLV